MAEPVRARRLTDEEGRRLTQIVRRGRGSPIRVPTELTPAHPAQIGLAWRLGEVTGPALGHYEGRTPFVVDTRALVAGSGRHVSDRYQAGARHSAQLNPVHRAKRTIDRSWRT